MRPHPHGFTRLTRALPVAAMFGATMLAACAGVEVLGNDSTLVGTGGGTGGVIGGGGGGSQSSALVGQWTRTLLVETPDGDIHESRTTWEFRADGSAIRTILAWNWTEGLYDTLTSVAQWSTSGSNLTIVYIAGTSGTLTLPWSVSGDVLTIGPDQFARVR